VVGIALTYWPHSQLRAERKTFWEILPKIDFIGGFLSTGGLTLLYVNPSTSMELNADYFKAWLELQLADILLPGPAPESYVR
jgi:hypothetical protein